MIFLAKLFEISTPESDFFLVNSFESKRCAEDTARIFIYQGSEKSYRPRVCSAEISRKELDLMIAMPPNKQYKTT